ncbi:hypothetical protein HPB50_005997 [Hyalomma asiaticum]|uniref:Uncharacterized protein n=1 Tax=Hyalomma asiaticum TaxID=266040 RepID=A0ACB7S719_HYAAI|nr:hypothetical protein HPB50_005997 [Hyalomma asiaticum]
MESNGARQAKRPTNAFPRVSAVMPLPAALDRRVAVIKKQAPKRCGGSRPAIATQERRDDQEGGCSCCWPALFAEPSPRVQHVTSSMRKQDHNNEPKSIVVFTVHARTQGDGRVVCSWPVPGRR